jgi:TPP-dependent pyruvate/acetoin dehydrogenase alpha subunit
MGHSRGDPPYGPYRAKEELESWKKRDPILKLQSDLKISDEQVKEMKDGISREYEAAVQFAEESPYPSEAEALEYIYV